MGDCLKYRFMGKHQVPVYGVKDTKRWARGPKISFKCV